MRRVKIINETGAGRGSLAAVLCARPAPTGTKATHNSNQKGVETRTKTRLQDAENKRNTIHIQGRYTKQTHTHTHNINTTRRKKNTYTHPRQQPQLGRNDEAKSNTGRVGHVDRKAHN